MNTFDESKHPRDRGKFTAVNHQEPEVALNAGFDARFWGLPEHRPGPWVFGDESCREIVTGSVVDGPLSRAAASRESRESFESWVRDAAEHSSEGVEFAAGLEDGLRTLTCSDVDTATPEMLDAAMSAPLSKTSLVNWQLGLRNAPSQACRRGRMAAGVILSGAAEWWGIAENPDLAISGPAQSTPRRGAWSSLSSR